MRSKSIYPILTVMLAGCWVSASEPDPAKLDRVAEVATAMIDGDVCLHIQTPRSIHYAQIKDPRDPWRAGDNYDVDHAAFLATKKTLMRLAHLCATPCDVNLWMQAPNAPSRVEIVIRNVLEMSQFWTWGDLDQEMPLEMKQVLETEGRVTVRRKPGMVSVLAPVYDSLGDVVAIAEVVTQEARDPRENVK